MNGLSAFKTRRLPQKDFNFDPCNLINNTCLSHHELKILSVAKFVEVNWKTGSLLCHTCPCASVKRNKMMIICK